MNPSTSLKTIAYFGDKARYDIRTAANNITEEVCEVTYEFQEDGMHCWLGNESEIVFTHPSSALAYLHAFLLGYTYGREDSDETA